jgi:hypothetical protein
MGTAAFVLQHCLLLPAGCSKSLHAAAAGEAAANAMQAQKMWYKSAAAAATNAHVLVKKQETGAMWYLRYIRLTS